MAALPPFADAEAVVMALLEPVAPTVQTTPANLEEVTPIIQVTRVGGTDDYITDRPLMSVAVFGSTYAEAKALAEQCRQVVLGAGGTKVVTDDYPGGVLIDRTASATSPQERPYDNPELRRKIATYVVEMRRPR